jgi:hypothetical protein
MSVVVQNFYSPQIRPGLEGMISDTMPHAVVTRICETPAGIGFGKAVSQGILSAKGVLLGGAAGYVGMTCRDITLSLSNLDPMATTAFPLDKYGYRTNVAVITRGHLWVKSLGDAIAGDPVYYDATAGSLGNSATGMAANGNIVFAGQPKDGDHVSINGVVITFHTSGATGDDVNIGPTLGDTVVALASHLAGSATAGLTALKFATDPPAPAGVTQALGANTLLIAAAAVGTAANAFVLDVTGCSVATASGTTLAGGTAASVLVPGAHWLDKMISGQLGRISLFGG